MPQSQKQPDDLFSSEQPEDLFAPEEPTSPTSASKASPGFLDSISSYIPESVKSGYEFANKPLLDVTPYGRRASESITTPTLADSDSYWMPRIKGFLGGATEGLSNVASSLTSPLSLATMAASGGAVRGIPGASMLTRALSLPIAAHGAYQVATGKTPSEQLFGAAEMAGGGAGMFHVPPVRGGRIRSISPVPEVEPQLADLTAQHLAELTKHADEVVHKTSTELAQKSAIDEVSPTEQQPPVKPRIKANQDGTFTNLDTGEVLDKTGKVITPPEVSPERKQPFNVADLQGLERAPEIPGYKGGEQARATAEELSKKPLAEQLQSSLDERTTGTEQPRLASEFGEQEVAPSDGQDGGGEVPPKGPTRMLSSDELDPSIPITERKAPELQKASLASELYNLPRGLMSMDLPFMTSAAFRQASPMAWTGNWLKAWTKAAKAYGSTAAYDAMQADISNSKYFKPRYEPVLDKQGNTLNYREKPSYAEEVGLKTTDLRHLTSREESIASGLAERIPVYGQAVRASNRAYTAFLNDLRKNTLEKLVGQAKDIGENPETNLVLGKEIASFINNATGRGELNIGVGKKNINLEQSSKLLTNALFSPRLIASRIKFLNPSTYIQASPMVRQEYIKGLARSTVNWWALAGLAELAGATVNKDSNNADFGKIKIGNTRIDPGAGFQQYLVLSSRMRPNELGGGFTSSTTSKTSQFGQGYKPRTRLSTAQEFAANKLHPTARLAYDMMNASSDKPFNLGDELVQRVMPMMVTDIIQASKDSPELAALVGGLSSVGMGTQTYEPGRFQSPTYVPSNYDISFGGR